MKLDAIGIVAKDIKESVRFYSLLDLDFGELKPGEDHIEARAAGGLRVMIDSEELIRKLNPNWVAPIGQRMALAFLCVSPGEVDAAFARVCAAGFAPKQVPWDAFWGQRYASVIDPDGNSVDLFATL